MPAILTRLADLCTALGAQMLDWRDSPGRWEGTQLKTEADRLAHHYLVNGLRQIDPTLPIVSEEDESNHAEGRPERYFLIDPIDGTASLAGGFSGFVTQLAVMERDVPVLSVIYAPALKHLYLAAKGGGASLNGRPLRLAPSADRRLLIDNYPEPRGFAERAYQALHCTGYVESGSLGLKLARVADGTADLFLKDVTLKDWDIAPGHLLLEEAGGRLCLPDGSPFRYSGDYTKTGLIAAASPALAETCIHWLTPEQGARP